MNARKQKVQTVAVGSLPSVADVEEELDWVFTLAEGQMGNCSNFAHMLSHHVPEYSGATAEERAEAARKHSRILGCLRAMPSPDAGVLQAAYSPARWPLGLREELGPLTGIVVRLACGEMGLPLGRHEQTCMAERVAKQLDVSCREHGFKPIARLRVMAQDFLNTAHHAYSTARAAERTAIATRAKGPSMPAPSPQSLPLRSLYKMSELARAAGMTRWRLETVLRRAGVELFIPGGIPLVPLHELETKMKPLWESIKAAERLKQAAHLAGG